MIFEENSLVYPIFYLRQHGYPRIYLSICLSVHLSIYHIPINKDMCVHPYSYIYIHIYIYTHINMFLHVMHIYNYVICIYVCMLYKYIIYICI